MNDSFVVVTMLGLKENMAKKVMGRNVHEMVKLIVFYVDEVMRLN